MFIFVRSVRFVRFVRSQFSTVPRTLSKEPCSEGAAAAVALRLAAQDEFDGKTIVTILPDSGERYLSTALFGG